MATKLNQNSGAKTRPLTIPGKPLKAAPVKTSAPVEVKPAQPKEAKGAQSRTPRFTHAVESLYTGPSSGFTSTKSRTVFRHDLFGTQPDRVLTERTLKVAAPLKEQYGASPWKRGNFDAGVANALLAKGFLQPVNGEGRSEEDTYKFTDAAMSQKFA